MKYILVLMSWSYCCQGGVSMTTIPWLYDSKATCGQAGEEFKKDDPQGGRGYTCIPWG